MWCICLFVPSIFVCVCLCAPRQRQPIHMVALCCTCCTHTHEAAMRFMLLILLVYIMVIISLFTGPIVSVVVLCRPPFPLKYAQYNRCARPDARRDARRHRVHGRWRHRPDHPDAPDAADHQARFVGLGARLNCINVIRISTTSQVTVAFARRSRRCRRRCVPCRRRLSR